MNTQPTDSPISITPHTTLQAEACPPTDQPKSTLSGLSKIEIAHFNHDQTPDLPNESADLPSSTLSSILWRDVAPLHQAEPPRDTSVFLPSDTSPLAKFDAIISYDSEWTGIDADGKPCGDDPHERNWILSYQWSVALRDGAAWRYAEGIHYPQNRERLTSKRLIGMALESAGVGWRRAAGMNVLFVAHNDKSDLCGLEDGKALMKLCTAVRGVLATLQGERKWSAVFSQHHSATIRLTVLDTMLLAPQGDSPKTLAFISSYCQKGHEKVKIDEKWYPIMHKFLEADPQNFVKYAIGDTRATLEYFVGVQQTLGELGDGKRISGTLGAGRVDALVHHLGGLKGARYRRTFGLVVEQRTTKRRGMWPKLVPGTVHAHTEKVATDSFYDGLNVAFESGRRVCGPGQIILDLDFSGAYSSVMGAMPEIDWRVDAEKILTPDRVRQCYDAEVIARQGHFSHMLGLVDFEFPSGTMFPCLPMRDDTGVLYVLRGTTYATGFELELALRMGAKLNIRDVLYFPPFKDDDGRAVLPFAQHIGNLNRLRREHKRGTLPNMLYKEAANSIYGKLGQGLRTKEHRRFYDGDNGEFVSERVDKCAITCPHYAAACTGVTRAALSELIAELSAHEGFTVLSATTDGAMVLAPRRFPVEDLKPGKYGVLQTEHLDAVELYPELKALEARPAIQALIAGRRNMGLDPRWIEIKHVGDSALTLRTRTYVMWWKGIVQHKACTGVEVRDGDVIEQWHDDANIPTATMKHHPSPRDIMSGKAKDYVVTEFKRTVNTDYDHKRRLSADGSTVPHLDKASYHDDRKRAANIRSERRDRKKENKVVHEAQRATPERIEAARAGMRIKKGETIAESYRRYIHHAIARREGGWAPPISNKEVEVCLGLKYQARVKKIRLKPFETQRFEWCEGFKAVMVEECQKLGMALTPGMIRMLAVVPSPEGGGVCTTSTMKVA
jgi:hypothetical protein